MPITAVETTAAATPIRLPPAEDRRILPALEPTMLVGVSVRMYSLGLCDACEGEGGHRDDGDRGT
jgi:hypothetical protein